MMPFVERIVKPIRLSHVEVTRTITNELEYVTNHTLTNIIRQLSSLSMHAEDMFNELWKESNTFFKRVTQLNSRVEDLHAAAAQLNYSEEVVSLHEIGQKKRYCSSNPHDQQVISRVTMSWAIQEMYTYTCEKPPSLEKLNIYRDDGKDCLKFYTDPTYFFELWYSQIQKDIIANRKKELIRKTKSKVPIEGLQDPKFEVKKEEQNVKQTDVHEIIYKRKMATSSAHQTPNVQRMSCLPPPPPILSSAILEDFPLPPPPELPETEFLPPPPPPPLPLDTADTPTMINSAPPPPLPLDTNSLVTQPKQSAPAPPPPLGSAPPSPLPLDSAAPAPLPPLDCVPYPPLLDSAPPFSPPPLDSAPPPPPPPPPLLNATLASTKQAPPKMLNSTVTKTLQPPPTGRNALLEEIRRGNTLLRKADEKVNQHEVVVPTDRFDVHAMMARAFDTRRHAMEHTDSEAEDDDDDGRWQDDED